MTRSARSLTIALAACGLLVTADVSSAHDGPPYPIVSNQTVGAYRISIWTDPDTTDDDTRGGQFWVMIDPARRGASSLSGVRAEITIRPIDRAGDALTALAAPVNNDPSRQFAALRMDHEGRFAVHVAVDGDTGNATVDSEVQATYDLRPSRFMLVLYVLPFLLAGVLWTTLLVRRRRAQAGLAR